MKIDGAVAVVTGGEQGIGKAITKALLQNKSKVLLLYKYGYMITLIISLEFHAVLINLAQCKLASSLKAVTETSLPWICSNSFNSPHLSPPSLY